ncbi:PhzF family phenazine biosynthesis protein [Streptomyces sp. NPDC053048]|uniref:PhzF family phenazine biosynthesis protein n=1 Tax=Streptomyces sp. NPDC053048 TaxID=3365694 RepID=UPI0037D69438
MDDLRVVRVFTGPDGGGGNPLGVVMDGRAVPDPAARQAIAAGLGFSETVFVDDAETGRVDIHTPSTRLPFAGHPLVGVAWLLRRQGRPVSVLRPPAGEVPVWTEDGTTWIRARAQWASGRRTERLATAGDVEALPGPPPGQGWLYVWAWEDEAEGRVRARGFPRRGDGIVEDEATGAAALELTAQLGRSLVVRQGTGSRILTRCHDDGTVDLGGSVSDLVRTGSAGPTPPGWSSPPGPGWSPR